jgi:hypothetical protein
MRIVALALLWLLFFACSNVQKEQVNQISFSHFFEKQIDQFQSNKMKLNKRLTYNLTSQLTLISNVDWKHELAPFIELNYPTIAQQKDYQIQRINLPYNAYCLSLKALNKQAKYKFIQVLFLQEQIHAITGYSYTYTFSQNTSNYLRYVANKSYELESAYQIKNMAANKYVVEGKIVN